MHFVADESVDGNVIRALRAAGYTVLAIADEMPSTKDPDVLAFAVSRNEVLLTEDKDFGELVHYRRQQHTGVILLRMNEISPADRVARTLMVLSVHEAKLKDAFTVISTKRVRIRPGH
jgi:predicted nuclease of predicted toxin-antitoxin system